MSTNINIDVVLQQLQQISADTTAQNRSERQEREDQVTQTAESVLATRRTQSVVVLSGSQSAQDGIEALNSQSADEHSGVPDLYLKRRPAAQRGGRLWFYCRDWVSRVHRVWVSGPATFNELDYYDVHDASTVRHYLTPLSSINTQREVFSNAVPEHLFKYGGSWNVQANLPFMNVASGGPRDFVEPPVYACAGGYIYGVQRHTECWTTTPLTDDFTGDPVCTWECRHWYVFFKLNAHSGGLQSKVVRETSTSTTISGWGPGYEDLLPWQSGGTEWRRIYQENAYSGDPSVAMRAQGYTGQYQVKAGRAYFALINKTWQRGTQYESYKFHVTPQDDESEYFWWTGSSANTGPNLTPWDYWQNIEVLEFEAPTTLAGWEEIGYLVNLDSPPKQVLQRSALDKQLYDPAQGAQVLVDGSATGARAAYKQAPFDTGTNGIYKAMYDYTDPPENLVTAPHNPPTSYQQDQDRWWEPKLHPLLYLL